MDINIGAQQESRYPAARFNEKGCLQVLGGDALRLLFFPPPHLPFAPSISFSERMDDAQTSLSFAGSIYSQRTIFKI